MTYDPSITLQIFRGLIYTAIAISIGFGFGLLLVSLLPGWDEG